MARSSAGLRLRYRKRIVAALTTINFRPSFKGRDQGRWPAIERSGTTQQLFRLKQRRFARATTRAICPRRFVYQNANWDRGLGVR